jgi:hypothetical protein
MAGSILSATAQAPNDSWGGEWGKFARIPAAGRIAEHFEGEGLSVTSCDGQKCHFLLQIIGKTSHGRAEGDLMIENDSEAVASIRLGREEKCTLAMNKTGTGHPSIAVMLRTGDCSDFVTPGASFEHTYTLRSQTPFYADDIPACFVGDESAMVALCVSKKLSAQEHDWEPLVWEVSDLGGPRIDMNAERLSIMKSCDAAPDAGSCLSKAFAKSIVELNARKDSWKASVTEPGDAGKAKRAIEAIEGSYRHSFANGDVSGDKFQSTDTLEIKRVSGTSIHYDVQLEFYNGHECSREGVASYKRAGAFVEQVQNDQGKLCVFEVIPTATGVQLADPTGMCRMTDCGARGGYNGTVFSFNERVKGDSTTRTPTGSH